MHQLLSKSCNFTENKVSCQADVRANTSDIFAYIPAEILRLFNQNFAASQLKWLLNLSISAEFDLFVWYDCPSPK